MFALAKNTVSPLTVISVFVADLFFKPTDVPGVFRCSCGTTRTRKPNWGTSNLMSHLKDRHKDYEKKFDEYSNAMTGTEATKRFSKELIEITLDTEKTKTTT